MTQRSFFAEQPPLFMPLVSYATGIALYDTTSVVFFYALMAASLLVALLFCVYRAPLLGHGVIVFSCCTLGFFLVKKQGDDFNAFYTTTGSHLWNVNACIENREKINHPLYDYQTTLTIHSLQNHDGQHFAINKSCLWYHQNKQPLHKPGEKITLLNVAFCKPVDEPYVRYLCKEGTQATLFGNFDTHQSTSIEHSASSHGKSFMLHNIKNSTIATSCSQSHQRTGALICSLFFGKKPSNKYEFSKIKQLFARWGLSHYLARSGLHLVIFVMVWSFLLRIVPLRFVAKELLLVTLVIGYWALSYSSISFLRAFWMFVIYKLCNIARLRINLLNVILLVAFATLLINPLQLFFLDFQLSFLLTYALGWIGSTRLRYKT